MDRSWAYRTP